MKKSNSISYSKNIFLDKHRMDELHSILLKHCRKIKIEAKCVDNASIAFDSYDELMTYSNFGKGRIKRLGITGYSDANGWDRKIYFVITSVYPKISSVDCTYHFTQTDEEIVFKQKIVDFWSKATKGYTQAFVLSVVVQMILFPIIASRLFFCFKNDWIIFLISICLLILLVDRLLYKCIWTKLFPMVSFSWGESVEYYKKIERWKNEVFWSVIMAIPVAIFASYMFELLKGG